MDGSEGRRGFKANGLWRGFAETVDFIMDLVAGREVEERERLKREEILTLAGSLRVLGAGEMKWVGRN